MLVLRDFDLCVVLVSKGSLSSFFWVSFENYGIFLLCGVILGT